MSVLYTNLVYKQKSQLFKQLNNVKLKKSYLLLNQNLNSTISIMWLP